MLAELALQHPIGAPRLLLLAQAHAILGWLASTSLTVLAGRVAASLDGALRPEAALTLQKQLLPFASAESTNRTSVTSHVGCSLLREIEARRSLTVYGHPTTPVIPAPPSISYESAGDRIPLATIAYRLPTIASLDAPSLRRAAAVVRDRRHVGD